MTKKRRHFTGEEKVAILKQHLVDQRPISDICDEHQLAPTMFYQWQKQFFENGAQIFDKPNKKAVKKETAQIAQLEEKLKRKHEVLSELMEEHVQLKKQLGGP